MFGLELTEGREEGFYDGCAGGEGGVDLSDGGELVAVGHFGRVLQSMYPTP